MVVTTGISMRSLGSLDLFDAAYASMVRRTMMTEDEGKALDQLDKAISDSSFESETGMPAITKWMAPANAGELPPHVMGPDRGDDNG